MTVQEIDDTNNQIAYYGSWNAYVGGDQSTRQWEGSIHSTSQNGGSATITFIGTRVAIYCTVPSGSGTNSIGTITFDGQKSTVTRRTSSNAVYADLWFDSGQLANVKHTITIANGGSSSDSPLQLDRFHVEGDAILDSAPVAPVTSPKSSSSAQQAPAAPTPPGQSTSVSVSISTTTVERSQSGVVPSSSSSPSSSGSPASSSSPSSSSSSSNSSGGSSSQPSSSSLSSGITANGGEKTVTAVQFVTTAADGSVTTQFINSPTQQNDVGAGSSTPIGAIVGGVLGGILVLGIVILLLCLRRRRRSQGRPFFPLSRGTTTGGTPRLTGVTPFHRASQLEQTSERQEPETSELSPATNASSPPDQQSDPIIRRLTEKNPAYLNTQTPLSLDPYATNRLQTQYGDLFDHQTPTSMYASTVFTPPESSNNRPPSYQSTKILGNALLSPQRDEKHLP